MAPFAPSLTIMIPAFNERENLPRVLGELLAWARGACREFEILVVDDGSSDGTAAAIPADPNVRVIVHPQNRGLTATLRTGFFGAAKEFVIWAPADGQIPAAELGKILDAWRGEDLVLSTYRHRPDGWKRALMSRTLRALLWAATGLTDRLEGVYLFRRAMIDDMHLVARTSAGSIGFEIAAKARAWGYRLGSTEIECAPRLSGVSKVANARNVTATLGEIWRIRQSLRAHRPR
jgi:glycosyltransferase involved in cell wall biosynthesis